MVSGRQEVEYAYKILDEGTSADRQLKIYKEIGSLEAVVDNLIRADSDLFSGREN